MRRESLASLKKQLKGYRHFSDLQQNVEGLSRGLQPVAVILFGSLAKGDFHEGSDADICVVLPQVEIHPFRGYDMVASYDPSGIVQPVVYGLDQLSSMVEKANGFALEVLHYGIVLCGTEPEISRLEALFEKAKETLGIEKTETGWLINA